jgi:hypothetical protein
MSPVCNLYAIRMSLSRLRHYALYMYMLNCFFLHSASRTMDIVKVKVILRPTVCPSVHLGIWDPRPIFPILDFFDSFRFIDVGRPLWREVGSVLFSFCEASPAQHFSDLSPTGLMSIVYCLYFWNSPNQEGQVPVFISPRNRVAQLYPRPLGSMEIMIVARG